MAYPVDMTKCGLSSWDGDELHCRLCNTELSGRQRAWCSKRCYQIFERNHRYSTARNRCRATSRAECSCPDSEFTFRVVDSKTGELKAKRRPKHPVCANCGKCEPELLRTTGRKLECNHTDPVLGGRRSWTCLNHEDLLEMLCHECHLEVTREQRKMWPKHAVEIERVKRAEAPLKRKQRSRTTKPRRNTDRPVKRAARRRIA